MQVRLRPLHVSLLAGALALTSVTVGPPTASAAPVCVEADKTSCSGRTFEEPADSDTALQYAETVAGLESLEAEFPDFVEIDVFGKSAGGRDLLAIELTDESVTAEKKVVFVSQSIHGNEPGGREGGVRWLEDVLRDAAHPSRQFLDDVVVVQVLLNPDGWAAGDPASPGLPATGAWIRGNGNGSQVPGDAGGIDLNRQLPWRGWIPDGRTPMSEPESRALVTDIERRLAEGQDITAAVDIHGEVADAGALTLLSAGEFDLAASLTQLEHARAIDVGVSTEIAGDPLLGGTPPVVIHASSEFGANNSGGSGSGFLGDWLAQTEGGASLSTSTIELFEGGGGPGTNATNADLDLLQLYRDTVAGVMTALVEQAVIVHTPTVTLPGEVGYVHDPATTDDPTLTGQTRTAMRFFDDLNPYLSTPLRQISPDAVATSLDGLSGVIVPSNAAADATATAALKAFAEAGGDVVLTDTGVQLLDDLNDDIEAADITLDESNIAVVNFDQPSGGARDHMLIDGIREIAFLLVEPATIGYQVTGGGDVPSWRVDRASFEAAGGTTVGVTAFQTSVGVLPLGTGTVTTMGTFVPPPVATNRNDYGLNNYGVLDTGYQILFNALGATLSLSSTVGAPGPTPAPTPTPTGTETEQPGTRTLARVAGGTRFTTAVANAQLGFPSSSTVVLARADDFPDALAGSVLAAKLDAPILLTGRDALDPDTAAELDRLGATNVVLLGRELALSAQVELDVKERGISTIRLGGADRHDTARLIAAEIVGTGKAESAIITRSDAFTDALAASNLATALRAPIILTPSGFLDDAAKALLADSVEDGARIVIAGGTAAISTAVEQALADEGHPTVRRAGADRYETAVELVNETLTTTSRAITPLFIASGTAFPDALTAGPVAARLGGVLVLTAPTDLGDSSATRTFLVDTGMHVTSAYVVGGDVAITQRTFAQIRDSLNIQPE